MADGPESGRANPCCSCSETLAAAVGTAEAAPFPLAAPKPARPAAPAAPAARAAAGAAPGAPARTAWPPADEDAEGVGCERPSDKASAAPATGRRLDWIAATRSPSGLGTLPEPKDADADWGRALAHGSDDAKAGRDRALEVGTGTAGRGPAAVGRRANSWAANTDGGGGPGGGRAVTFARTTPF